METNRRRDVLLLTVPYSPWRCDGVRRYAREAGWNLVDAYGIVRGLEGWRGDGALLSLRDNPEMVALVRRLRRRGIPVVDMTHERPDVRLPRVCLDNRAIGRAAAEHFAGKNYRNAVWFSTNWTEVHARRFNGFCEVWAEHHGAGAMPDRHVLMEELPERSWSDTRVSARWFAGILTAAPKPLAAFCQSTHDAARVEAECRSLGVAVPQEVAILGCGDDQMPCENQPVPLSCVLIGGERQGYEAAALLARLMNGEAPPRKPVIVPFVGLAVRASTDMMAVADPIVAKALAMIASNLPSPWGVAQLCRELGVGPRRICRHFTAELGRSPGEEILRQRLERAKSLLRDTGLPLAAVAERCGLCHASYLTNLFRRHFGLTPRAWRNGCAGGNPVTDVNSVGQAHAAPQTRKAGFGIRRKPILAYGTKGRLPE